MTESLPLRESDGLTLPLRVADLNGRRALAFHLRPESGARSALALDLGIEKIRKIDFRGTLTPDGRHDWRLEGTLGATVVQACIISAEPVQTRIDTSVIRSYRREMPASSGPDSEIPDDDTLEPLGAVIDPGAVMTEALALALPDYPRAEGATLPESALDGLGDDLRRNPFAVLQALKDTKD